MGKRTTIYLDDDIEDLAPILKRRGVTNLSEVVRDLVMFLISEGKEELTKTQIREKVRQFTEMKLAELQQQQKITGQTQEEKAQVEAILKKRRDAIDAATRQEVDRIGRDRFQRYLDDTTGDYQSILDDVIAAITTNSGQNAVQLCDLVESFGRVKADAHR